MGDIGSGVVDAHLVTRALGYPAVAVALDRCLFSRLVPLNLLPEQIVSSARFLSLSPRILRGQQAHCHREDSNDQRQPLHHETTVVPFASGSRSADDPAVGIYVQDGVDHGEDGDGQEGEHHLAVPAAHPRHDEREMGKVITATRSLTMGWETRGGQLEVRMLT